MPGRGRAEERSYGGEERAAIEAGAEVLGLAIEDVFGLLGNTTFDIYLNDIAFWQCIPSGVWNYTLGGYRVIKKWLSYRENNVLGRSLSVDEIREVTSIARRIAAILLMEPGLDGNYRRASGGSAEEQNGPKAASQ